MSGASRRTAEQVHEGGVECPLLTENGFAPRDENHMSPADLSGQVACVQGPELA